MIAAQQQHQRIVSTVLRRTLLGFSPSIDVVLDSTGIHKIFWERVEEGIELPYITLQYNHGQPDNSISERPYISQVWQVKGHATDMVTARTLGDVIAKLHRAQPDISSYTDLYVVSSIREITAIFNTYTAQNYSFFENGGFYEVRLEIGDC